MIFARKRVPETLPSLGLDRIRSINSQDQFNQQKNTDSQLPSVYQPLSQHTIPVYQNTQSSNAQVVSQPQPISQPQIQQKPQLQVQQILNSNQETQAKSILRTIKTDSPEEEEQGYFKQLIKSVTEENEDMEKLTSWYENKFLPNDLVFQMREYWEKQQPELLLKNIRGDLKRELMEKTNKLHALEAEWQDTYFKLLAKEDEIRKEERELKESLTQFMDIFKKSIKNKKDTKPKTA